MCFCRGPSYVDCLVGGTDSASDRAGLAALLATISEYRQGNIGCLCADLGNCFFAGATDRTVRCFDLRCLPKSVRTYETFQNDINVVVLSPDEHLLASAGNDNRTIVFDQRFPKKPLHVLAHETLYEGGNDAQGVAAVEWMSSGFLVTGGEDNTIRIWDPRLQSPELHVLRGHGGTVSAVAIAPQEDLLASGGDETKVQLYGMHTCSGTDASTCSCHDYPFSVSSSKISNSGVELS